MVMLESKLNTVFVAVKILHFSLLLSDQSFFEPKIKTISFKVRNYQIKKYT